MKRTLALFIVSSFLFYSVGFQFVYQWQEASNRAEIHETIHQKAKQQFKLSQANYSALINSENEFSYKGYRYDVVSVVYFKDSVVVNCFHDIVEEQIAELFNDFVHHFLHGNSSNEKKGTLAKYIAIDFLPVEKFDYYFFAFIVKQCKREDIFSFISSTLLPFIGPPPERVV